MIEWFNQLESREQFVLSCGVLIAAGLIGWNFLWVPLQLRSEDLGGAVADKSSLIVELRRAAGLRATAAGTGTAGTTTSLIAVINLAAEPLGFGSAIERTSLVGGGDAIRVSLRSAPFDTLVSWLDVLEQQHGVAVATADIATTGQTGTINGQIVLERS
jgi:type II secretory pathway component PulM